MKIFQTKVAQISLKFWAILENVIICINLKRLRLGQLLKKHSSSFIPSSGHTADKEFVREILVEVLLEMFFDFYGQSETTSVTRLGNLMHFVQLFQACGDNYFAQIAHIFRQFVEMF